MGRTQPGSDETSSGAEPSPDRNSIAEHCYLAGAVSGRTSVARAASP